MKKFIVIFGNGLEMKWEGTAYTVTEDGAINIAYNEETVATVASGSWMSVGEFSHVVSPEKIAKQTPPQVFTPPTPPSSFGN